MAVDRQDYGSEERTANGSFEYLDYTKGISELVAAIDRNTAAIDRNTAAIDNNTATIEAAIDNNTATIEAAIDRNTDEIYKIYDRISDCDKGAFAAPTLIDCGLKNALSAYESNGLSQYKDEQFQDSST